jgi:L-alanine-DL-glutamate epimerase-like enolase superfamily enzyme
MIERYEPYWFEEPIKPDDYRGQAALCAALDTPLASGENEFTRWGFRDLIEARAVDVVQADARTCGGITEWLKIAAFASAYHLPMAPHGNVYAGANCVAAVSNGLIVEYRPRLEQDHSHDLYDPPTVKDGHITLSDEPGLGVPWREDLIKRYYILTERGTGYRFRSPRDADAPAVDATARLLGRDAVSAQSEASFPASDSPSWSGATTSSAELPH